MTIIQSYNSCKAHNTRRSKYQISCETFDRKRSDSGSDSLEDLNDGPDYDFNNCGSKKNSSKKKKEGGKGKLITPAEFAGMKVVICPRKKGNVFDLPMGAQICIPEGVYKNKDRFTVVMVPPNKRAEFCPKLGLHDKLASSMYVFSSVRDLRSPIEIFLPSVLEDTSHIFPLFRGSQGWVTVNESSKEHGGVRFSIEESGTVVLIWTTQSETFDVPIVGELYYSKLNSLIQIRVPKKAVHFNEQCKLQIIGIRHERIEIARKHRPRDMADVQEISEFYSFEYPDVEFERTVTIRLPLPDWAKGSLISDDSENPPMIAYKYNGQWDVIQTPLKFTKDTVSFEARVLDFALLNH